MSNPKPRRSTACDLDAPSRASRLWSSSPWTSSPVLRRFRMTACPARWLSGFAQHGRGVRVGPDVDPRRCSARKISHSARIGSTFDRMKSATRMNNPLHSGRPEFYRWYELVIIDFETLIASMVQPTTAAFLLSAPIRDSPRRHLVRSCLEIRKATVIQIVTEIDRQCFLLARWNETSIPSQRRSIIIRPRRPLRPMNRTINRTPSHSIIRESPSPYQSIVLDALAFTTSSLADGGFGFIGFPNSYRIRTSKTNCAQYGACSRGPPADAFASENLTPPLPAALADAARWPTSRRRGRWIVRPNAANDAAWANVGEPGARPATALLVLLAVGFWCSRRHSAPRPFPS